MGERTRPDPPGRRPPPPHWQGSSIRQQVKNLLSGLHGLHRMEKKALDQELFTGRCWMHRLCFIDLQRYLIHILESVRKASSLNCIIVCS